ncbi:chromosome transmission fidelity protein 8 [Massariosphaeria phaeospora]|uniref:Chromosome transmission fidelity protein 8 n=1 Tax=Massariosphaeria phaeospora TaxID=100035 RepID=A0A7C8I2P1_9PLEO|nr:chromosome transmission fidelity protein 8 [Massariosphaeria phaeospora]
MPLIPLHIRKPASTPTENPLPHLLHTPSGLAILELQGTIHFPTLTQNDAASTSSTKVGKLVFPLYNTDLNDPSDTKWMKRVYFYVGVNQRMTGECKKLGKPFAIIRRKEESGGDTAMGGIGDEDGAGRGTTEELEIVEVVRYKIVFSTRPEPVGGGVEEA